MFKNSRMFNDLRIFKDLTMFNGLRMLSIRFAQHCIALALHSIRIAQHQHFKNALNFKNVQHFENVQHFKNFQHLKNVQHSKIVESLPECLEFTRILSASKLLSKVPNSQQQQKDDYRIFDYHELHIQGIDPNFRVKSQIANINKKMFIEPAILAVKNS